MTNTKQDREVTDRLVSWIEEEFGHRGRFTTLESLSSIPAQRWKNVYYGRQGATQEMLSFVQASSTNAYEFVMTGTKRPPPEGYPFITAPPSNEERANLTTRLKWAIKDWASPVGADLFAYLERRSSGEISADAWARIYLANDQPTASMIEVVCKARPHFAAWIICGAEGPQVDPSDAASVSRWVAKQNEKMDSHLTRAANAKSKAANK